MKECGTEHIGFCGAVVKHLGFAFWSFIFKHPIAIPSNW